MTQDEFRLSKYNAVKAFIETNHRKPSRHRIEDHLMMNWLKQNRKSMIPGKMKKSRVEMFKKLLEMGEKYKGVNQYV